MTEARNDDEVPVAGKISDEAISAFAPRETAAYGCFFRTNNYLLEESPYDVVFFLESWTGRGSTTRIDFDALGDWYNFQRASRPLPPKVGVYFPFEGEEMYKTLAAMNAGMSSMIVRLPLALQSLRGRAFLSEVCVPSSFLAMMKQEIWKFPTEQNPLTSTWIPHAALSSSPHVHDVQFDIPQQEVRSRGAKGYLRYSGETSSALPASRVPFSSDEEAADATAGDIRDVVSNINALGIRVWVCMPVSLLQNPDTSVEWLAWREANLAAARAVAASQTTPIMACGQPKAALLDMIPSDVLVVTERSTHDDSAGAWRMIGVSST